MDSIQHALQKIQTERAASASLPSPTPSPTTDAPPAYTEFATDEDDDDEDDPCPVTLTLDTNTVVKGVNNTIALSASPLADATRFSALLLAAVQKINQQLEARGQSAMKVNLVIQAGVTVIGNGNIVGNTPIRAVGGKRKRIE